MTNVIAELNKAVELTSHGDCVSLGFDFLEGLQKHIESLEKEQAWVDINTALPEFEVDALLLFTDGKMMSAMRVKVIPDDYCWVHEECGCSMNKDFISHWKPIPTTKR